MSNSEFNQAVSFKVYAQAHVRTDGSSAIYLRVIIDRLKKEFNLKVYWPIGFFDDKRQKALPRHPKDNEVDAVNMVIDEAKGRATRIKLRYFTDSKRLTLQQFSKEFENYESRDNFVLYWENKIIEVSGTGHIGESTAVRHQTNVGRFKDFINAESFSMGELSADLAQRYKKWLSKKLEYNTVIGALKCLQTYINHARRDGFKIDDPFEKMSLTYHAGESRDALELSEIKRLQKLLAKESLPDIAQEVLRKFLFSCFTGLRISDNKNVNTNSKICTIKEDVLKIKLVKGRRFGKTVQIPLSDYALSLIADQKGQIFKNIDDSDCNTWLKVIAKEATIEKNLTFHVSRDTFATMFISLGGDVYTLKEILGHEDIKTTSIYVKMSENRKGILMNNFNNL